MKKAMIAFMFTILIFSSYYNIHDLNQNAEISLYGINHGDF